MVVSIMLGSKKRLTAGIALCVSIRPVQGPLRFALPSCSVRMLTSLLCLLSAVCLPALADDVTNLKPDDTDKPTAQFDEMLQTSQSSSLGLTAEAQRAVDDSRYDRALQIVKIGLHRNNDEMSLHKIYAEALEGKLSEQAEGQKDRLLYEQCVREWLVVMRSEVGEEKGLNIGGAGGVFDSLYKDDDGYTQARYHLKQLTGSIPRPWETDTKYLARVLKPAHEVKAKLVQKPSVNAKPGSAGY
jgi:hypothetical protein